MSRSHLHRVHGILIGLFLVGFMPQGAGADQGSARPVLEIGKETGSLDETFFGIRDIALAASGDIYVLDHADRMVKRFSPEGEFLGAFGREGGGPGEFRRPASIVVDSVVRVFDAAQFRESIFDQDGRHIRTSRIVAPDDIYPRDSYRMRSGHWVVTTTAQFSPGAPGHDPYFHVLAYRSGTSTIDTLITMHSGGTVWTARDQSLPWGIASSEFGPAGAWAIAGDSVVAVVDGYTGRIGLHRFDTDGRRRLIAELTVPVASKEITRADLAEVRERYLEERRGRADVERQIDLYPPPAWSGATAATFDDTGRLWITVPPDRASGGTAWLVVDPDGSTVKVCLPDSFRLKVVRDGRLYGTAATPNGASIVRVYALKVADGDRRCPQAGGWTRRPAQPERRGILAACSAGSLESGFRRYHPPLAHGGRHPRNRNFL